MGSAVLWARGRRSGRLPRGFWRLWTVVAAARAAQFVEPFLPVLLAVQLRAGPGAIAAVLLVQQAAAVLGFGALGPLSTRLGVAGGLRLGLVAAAGALSVRLPVDRSRGGGGPGQRPAGMARSARRPFWLVIVAVAPATALMFQAFSGLAVALPESQYRTVVLVNAVVLVLGQGLTGALVRRVPAAVALAGATLLLGAGIAGQAVLPFAGR